MIQHEPLCSGTSTSPAMTWLEVYRQNCDMQVEEIPWNASKEWSFDHHSLRHKTGGFFAIVGVRATVNGAEQHRLDQPLIDQPEIASWDFLFEGEGKILRSYCMPKQSQAMLGSCR